MDHADEYRQLEAHIWEELDAGREVELQAWCNRKAKRHPALVDTIQRVRAIVLP